MKTHYRHLIAVYNTQTETYSDLLHVNGKTDIHTQIKQPLMKGKQSLELNRCRTKNYGLNTAIFKSAVIRNYLTNQFQEAKSLLKLKTLIREGT